MEFWEALEDAKDSECNMELIAGYGKLEKTRFGVTLLEQETWRVLRAIYENPGRKKECPITRTTKN